MKNVDEINRNKFIIYGLYYFCGFFIIDKILVNEFIGADKNPEFTFSRITWLVLIHLQLNYLGKILYYFLLSIYYIEIMGIFKGLSLILFNILFPLSFYLMGGNPIDKISLDDYTMWFYSFSILFLFFEDNIYGEEDIERRKDIRRRKNNK